MFDIKLFLGFSPDAIFLNELQKTNPYIVSLFLGNADYLQEVLIEEKRFFGKWLPSMVSVAQIEDMEKHLLSLLARLAPSYLSNHNPCQLLIVDE